MTVSAEDFVDKLQADCLEHPAMKHSYLKRFENRELNKDQVKIFAEQYYCFSRHFSRYLAALVAITPDEASRAPLMKNMADVRKRIRIWMQNEHILQYSEDF